MTPPASGAAAPAVDDPTDLGRDEYVGALKRTFAEIKSDDVPGLAAGVAFKIFLSLFPALFATVAVFSLVTTVAELREWLDSAGGFLPDSAIALMQRPLEKLVSGEETLAGFAAVMGVATGLWAATGAAASLMKALSRAYDVPETRKFVRQRLVALALTVALLVALLGIVALLVLGPQLQTALLGDVVPPISWVLAAGRFILAIGVLVVLFAFVYWVGPDRDQPRWVWISPGAVLGVVGWLVASGGFTFYAQTAGSYSETYGAIAGVAVLLIWLQISMLVILVGAEFNAEIERARALHVRVTEGAGFAVPEPAAALVPPDPLSSTAAMVEAQMSAHSLDAPNGEQPGPDSVPTAPLPLPSAPADGAGPPGPVRKAGALAAGVMAAAVFLGFARKRARR